ncbi:hemerythrin domain-containing protein [Inhella gelatinilytica]|uniref:Hemerythrin domain-containing protein n=1 Tax=Inhella gelatinilytica TaxID=2795030 RepID=A0A931NEG0_9BURK|nr:hemerythrin domain-containing protein [Inhella gelatinilytica]MBH9553190.1 hemerythrin domain-containing protein [Inhella gelatinilytica]
MPLGDPSATWLLALRRALWRWGRALGLPLRAPPDPSGPPPTQLFRDQHQELLALATQLESCLAAFRRSGSASQVRECLSRLLGRLETHLIAEDCFMYPALLNHMHEDLANLAKDFAGEMGGMAGVFVQLGQRWASASSIEAHPEAFESEVTGFLTALRDRIEREDRELYAMADQRGDLNFY